MRVVYVICHILLISLTPIQNVRLSLTQKNAENDLIHVGTKGVPTTSPHSAHSCLCSTSINSGETHFTTFLRALSGPLAKLFFKPYLYMFIIVKKTDPKELKLTFCMIIMFSVSCSWFGQVCWSTETSKTCRPGEAWGPRLGNTVFAQRGCGLV